MSEADEIQLEEYELTNIDIEGYYVVRLKDGNSYRIYKDGDRDYILKDGKEIYLSNEVRKAVLSNIREYERYGI